MRKQFIAVFDDQANSGKGTSSILKQAIGALARLTIGIDAFKGAWKTNGSAGGAIADATGTTKDQLSAKLRAAGIDPDTYYASIEARLGDDIEARSTDQINDAFSDAQTEAADNSHQLWLFAGLGLLLLGGFAGTGTGRKAFGRMSSWTRSKMARYRKNKARRRYRK